MTVSWLLDANVVSEMMRFRPDGRVALFLDSLAPQQVGFAAVTVWEVLNGIGRLEPGQRRRSLEHRFRSVVQEFGDRVVDWTLEDARMCAVIMEDKRRRGEPLDSQLADAFPRRRRGPAEPHDRHPQHPRLPQHRSPDGEPLARSFVSRQPAAYRQAPRWRLKNSSTRR